MKTFQAAALLVLAMMSATAARGQDVTTTFTLAAPTSNCISVLTQDGAPSSGAVCPSGFFGGGGMQLWLQNDPVAPGQSLTLYECATSVVSNTVPPYGSATQQPPGSLVTALTCTGNESWYTPTWTGTLTYNYVSKLVRRCVGGRGAHCVTNFIPVWSSGDGVLTTPEPPPPPPPPPPPIVTTIAIAGGVCSNYVCGLQPAAQDVVTSATLDFVNLQTTIVNADGSVLTGTVDSWNIVPTTDDEDGPQSVSAQGSLYDADGNFVATYDVEASAQPTDSGDLQITSGTLTEVQ
jgi:hypothetical protein